jgi:hypothetical protein
MKPKGEKFFTIMKKLFSDIVVFFCDESANQNNKVVTSVNVGSEEHMKSKHKLD